MSLTYGAHVSIGNGFLGAAMQAVEEYRTNAMQIFIKSPRSSQIKNISNEEATEFRAYTKQAGLRFFVAHCSYLLNFAKDPVKNKWAVDLLINDIECVDKLGGNGVVLHIGKYLEMEKSVACKNIAESIHMVLDETSHSKVPLLLETTAGQGTEIGYRFDELRLIYKAINRPKRVKFCVDTCHIFAAGYDITSKKAVQETLKEWDKHIGTEKIACIHFNESMKPLGSRVDRHETLDNGRIGKEGLLEIAKFAVKHNIPLILETPEKIRTHGEELDLMRAWFKKASVSFR